MHSDQSPYLKMIVAACLSAGARGSRRAAESRSQRMAANQQLACEVEIPRGDL
jgi:hypothetical protein